MCMILMSHRTGSERDRVMCLLDRLATGYRNKDGGTTPIGPAESEDRGFTLATGQD